MGRAFSVCRLCCEMDRLGDTVIFFESGCGYLFIAGVTYFELHLFL
jgi:hypothetical protein